MSSPNSLVIYVKLVTSQAEKADQQFHSGVRARIKQTADALAKAESEQIKGIKARERAYKDSANAMARIDADSRKSAMQRARQAANDQQKIDSQARQMRRSAEQQDAKLSASDQAKFAAESRARRRAEASDHANRSREMLDADRTALRERLGLHQQELKSARATRDAETTHYRQSKSAETDADRERSRKLEAITAARIKATTKGLDAEKESVGGLVKAYAGLSIANTLAQVFEAAWRAMGRSAEDARQHIHGIVEEMERARTATKELANLEGRPATALYSAQQAREAAAVGASPEDYVAGKKAFQEYGAQYVGKENATPEERAEEVKDKKIAYGQSQEIQQGASLILGAMGLDKNEGMKLLGTVISKTAEENPNASTDEILLQFRRLAEAARTATGATGVGIGQLQESIQESVGPSGDLKSMNEAAVLMRTMQQIKPEEGAMLSRNLLRGLSEIRRNKHGEMDELGVTKDMDTFQQLEQIAKRIPEIAAETGESESDVERRLFKDSREYRSARAVFEQGMKGQGFERTRKAMDSVTGETIRREGRDYLNSEEGQKRTSRSRVAEAERERASRYVPFQKALDEAEVDVVRSGELETPETVVEHEMTSKAQELNYGDRKRQLQRTIMASNLRDRMMQSEGGREWLRQHGAIMKNVNGKPRLMNPSMSGLSGPMADDKLLAEGYQRLEQGRRGRPEPMQQANPAVQGAGDFEQSTTTSSQRIQEEQNRNRAAKQDAASDKFARAASLMEQAARFGVPAPLPSRPHVQRN